MSSPRRARRPTRKRAYLTTWALLASFSLPFTAGGAVSAGVARAGGGLLLSSTAGAATAGLASSGLNSLYQTGSKQEIDFAEMVEAGLWGAAFQGTGDLAAGLAKRLKVMQWPTWYWKGAEGDLEWYALSSKDKFFYDLGNKTLPPTKYKAGGYDVMSKVEAGRALWEREGPIRAMIPEGPGWSFGFAGPTKDSGTTPAGRLFFGQAAHASVFGARVYELTRYADVYLPFIDEVGDSQGGESD